MANTCESPGAPLELDKPIFKDVKFYVSGQVHEKALDLLKSGGAERMNYFSDYVTHLICGPDCEETDLCDATEIYEIPALVEKWIYLSAKLKCLVNTKPFIYDPNKLFSGLTFAFSKVGQDRNSLWSLITYNGGVVLLNFTDRATHLVTPYADGEKYAKASERPDRVVVVSPDWIVESVKSKTLLQTTLYHPKLILYPKRPDTTAITGFEPEAPAEADDGTATDSTQALLDKLKQRMPWNQPAEPPPNVVAPSFAGGQKPPEQQRIFAPAGQQQPQFGPRGVVHHTPPYSQMNSPNFNRILEQIQRPNVPGVNRLGQQQQQFLQQQQKQNVLLQQRQMAPAAARQIFQQQQPQMVRQMVGNPMLQQQQQNQQKMQQLLQQNQQRLVLGPQQQQQNMLMQQKQQQQQQMLQNVEQQQQVVQQNLMQQQQQHPKSQPQQQIPPNQIVQQQMGQVAPQQQPPQQVQQQLVQNQGLNQLIGQQQQQQQQQMGLNQQQLMHQQQQGMISQASLLSPQQQQQQQHIVTSIPQQHMITSIQQQQQQLVQSQPQQTMVSMQQQQQQQQLLVQQQQQQQTIMPQMQFGKQFGQQIVTSNPQQNQQFVSSGPPTPFLQSQSGFAPQQQQQQQQQQPQPQQPGQFLQQTGQAPNLQIINQQQIVNQQMQKQPPHMMQQQQQPQQFQPGGQRPAIWQQQINVRHPNGVNVVQQQPQGPRVQWVGAGQQPQPVQRQYIHLDAQTHQQLQQMAPEERALFVQKIQKQRLLMQRQQIQLQQQRSGHILIRSSGPVPPGMNTQQHMQWLQQQAKQQGLVLQQQQQQQQQQQPQQPQQPPPAQSVPPPQHPAAPGLSPIQQPQQQPFADQNLQLQRQQLRLQQLQMQREQAQKNLQQQQQQQQPQQVAPLQARPQPAVDPTGVPPAVLDANQQTPLVNAKTKTALANMLSIRLQSGGSAMGPGSEAIAEPSAAGTLRLMTAQHNASLNPNGRAQEILALQQQRRAAIGGAPTPTDIIRPPGPPSAAAAVPVVPQSPQNEPPKLQYSPRSVLPIQHRPGTFYGHNPNLKLPPDLFLLGCIFVVVELERFLDESMPGWQRKIEKHGGEIEKQYCSRVTHVLCETQRHGVVMQALRDYKRCVTLYWLSDVLKRKQVLPPWTALHLPTVYLDTVPAAKHLISLTGFTGTERERVKHMIKYTGASLTTYLTKHNTLLIATRPEGAKYNHAKKWGIPVVNIQWLTDVMLGNFSALNQMEHLKYQQFGSPANFCFDPVLVPNLMHAWKMPINISQESYERVKRSASPVQMPPKAKKIKLEQVTDENDNLENVPISGTHRVLFSRCTDVKELRKMVVQLGGSLAKSASDATHLVLSHLQRTTKLLHCMCVGAKIVSESWLRDSHAANVFLDEPSYAPDPKDFNAKYKCDFAATMSTRNRSKLFDGKCFFVTPSVFPSKRELTEIIRSCGGVVERTRRTMSQIEATNTNSPYSYIILTHEHDLHLVADLLKNKKDKIRIVCNVELVLSAVLRQTFEVEPYVVKVV